MAAASSFFPFLATDFDLGGDIEIACGISVIAFYDAMNQTRIELSEENTNGWRITFPLCFCFEFQHRNCLITAMIGSVCVRSEEKFFLWKIGSNLLRSFIV